MDSARMNVGEGFEQLHIVDNLLTINPFSRSGAPLDCVMALVVHYIGVAGQSSKTVRDYWEGLKSQDARDAIPDRSASAHFIIDFDGSIVRTIPESEKAYHCGAAAYTASARAFFGAYCTDPKSSPNRVTIGIELTHPKNDGRPSEATRESAVRLIRALCGQYDLDPRSHVWRHYDVTGKICPRWYVADPEAWRRFLASI